MSLQLCFLSQPEGVVPTPQPQGGAEGLRTGSNQTPEAAAQRRATQTPQVENTRYYPV